MNAARSRRTPSAALELKRSGARRRRRYSEKQDQLETAIYAIHAAEVSALLP